MILHTITALGLLGFHYPSSLAFWFLTCAGGDRSSFRCVLRTQFGRNRALKHWRFKEGCGGGNRNCFHDNKGNIRLRIRTLSILLSSMAGY